MINCLPGPENDDIIYLVEHRSIKSKTNCLEQNFHVNVLQLSIENIQNFPIRKNSKVIENYLKTIGDRDICEYIYVYR